MAGAGLAPSAVGPAAFRDARRAMSFNRRHRPIGFAQAALMPEPVASPQRFVSSGRDDDRVDVI
jgi:hypothetical protein